MYQTKFKFAVFMCKYLCYSITQSVEEDGIADEAASGAKFTGGGDIMYNIDILEKKRLEKGLSYTEIADQLGIHKVTVSRTLKGITLKPRTVKLLADYLGVEMVRIVQ